MIGFWNIARVEPDEVAIVEDHTGRSCTRGELAERSHRLVWALRGRGLATGSVLAAVMRNEIEFFEVLLAALQAGWYLVPVNHHFAPREVAYILQDSGAEVVVASASTEALVTEAADAAGLPADRRFTSGAGGALTSLADLAAEGRPEEPPDRTTGWFMTYTSGTTGRPKGIKRPLSGADPDEAGFAWRLQIEMFRIDGQAPHVHLVQSPCYHTAVLAFANSALQHGHRVVLMDSWSAVGALEAIQRYRVTTTHMVPTQFHRLLQLPDDVRGRYDVSSLQHVVHGAAPCPTEVKRRMIEWFGPVVTEYYGASEGGGTVATAEEWLERPGTVGRPWPGAEVRILDDDGNEVPPGTVGTVWLKAGALDFEYHNRPDATAESKRDGFFTVHDLGHVDEDGYLYLHGRASDVIITGGVNVHPSEIEGVLLDHPAVADVAVLGDPDPEWGERIVAVVQPWDGDTEGLAEALAAHCRAHLAGFKVPRSFEFVDSLPRDPNGKLYKRQLREQRAARART